VSYAPKVVLELPISDRSRLEPFVESCLTDGVVLIAIAGEGASEMDDLIDDILVGDGTHPDRFKVTTFHDDLEDALALATVWEAEKGDGI
jgi:hypothetical protein